MPRRTRPPATCHPDRPRHAKGLCRACYYRTWQTSPEGREKSRGNAIAYYYRNRAAILKKTAERDASLPADERARRRRAKFLRERYRMTPAEYAALIVEQGGKCGICERPFKTIDIDHDHATGAVRGLLCRGCNLGIEFFVKHAAVAAAYLRAAAEKVA